MRYIHVIVLKHYLPHSAPFRGWILTLFGSPTIVTLFVLQVVTYTSRTSDDLTVITIQSGIIHLLTGIRMIPNVTVICKINPNNGATRLAILPIFGA